MFILNKNNLIILIFQKIYFIFLILFKLINIYYIINKF